MNSSSDNFAGRVLAELGPFGWHKQSTGLFVPRLSTMCVVPSRRDLCRVFPVPEQAPETS